MTVLSRRTLLTGAAFLPAGPASNWAEHRFGRFSSSGVGGQFGVGLLMGAVWTPCVGPALGVASLMAARGENLSPVAFTMLAFRCCAGAWPARRPP